MIEQQGQYVFISDKVIMKEVALNEAKEQAKRMWGDGWGGESNLDEEQPSKGLRWEEVSVMEQQEGQCA